METAISLSDLKTRLRQTGDLPSGAVHVLIEIAEATLAKDAAKRRAAAAREARRSLASNEESELLVKQADIDDADRNIQRCGARYRAAIARLVP